MTIRVVIENDDKTRGLIVKYVERPRLGSVQETLAGEIGPGGKQEFHVHAARHLIVEEVP